MKFGKVNTAIEIREKSPAVAIICPSCELQVGFDEIIEREGNISCARCS